MSDVGGGIDLFWLTGDLRISATKQVDFLARMEDGELSFSEATHFFALNIDISDAAQAGLRREVAKAILADLGLID